MNRSIVLILFIGIFISCSKKREVSSTNISYNLSFKPKLEIGNNATIDNAWFRVLVSYCVLPNRNIYCLDFKERKIKVFDKKGKFLFNFGREGMGPGEFRYPKIITSSSKYIYVYDSGRKNISKFNIKGNFLKSTVIKDPVTKFDVFKNGNLVIETAKININSIDQSKYKLQLLNDDLMVINSSIYEHIGSNLAWVRRGPNGEMFTITIPFASSLQWDVIKNRLYVGYGNKFEFTVFDDNATTVGIIKKEIEKVKVSEEEVNSWGKNIVKKFENKSGFYPKIISKSLNNIRIPEYKPLFTKILETSNGFIVVLQGAKTKYKCIFFNKEGEEIGPGICEFDDFQYFFGKYYRITGGREEPYTLKIYEQEKLIK